MAFQIGITLPGVQARAMVQRAMAGLEAGDGDVALQLLDEALRLRPNLVEAHEARAGVLIARNDLQGSLAALEQTVRLDPARAPAWCYRATVLQRLGRTDDALASLERAIIAEPGLMLAHMTRGSLLVELERFEEALAVWEHLTALAPNQAQLWQLRGFALMNLGRYEEEAQCSARALALAPEDSKTRVNLAMCLLKQGRYTEGWTQFEARLQARAEDHDHYSGTYWRGEAPVAGHARLLVHHEEGAGDMVQFIRFVPELVRRGFEVMVRAPDDLIPLLQTLRCDAPVEFFSTGETRFNFECGALSLPGVLGVTLDDLPAAERYLSALPDRRARIEARLGERRRPRIGLAWSGNPGHNNDRRRSIAFARLAPLLAFDADWFGLQKEVRESDREAWEASARVAFLGEALVDFADTAAAIEAMDLIVSVDTSLVHVAGALGKPVWVLLPFDPDWRWLTGREDNPWYPSARLFRQRRRGDWEEVLGRVREALDAGAWTRD